MVLWWDYNILYIYIYMVGGFSLPLWKIWVIQLGWLFPTEWTNKKSSKPPTSDSYVWIQHLDMLIIVAAVGIVMARTYRRLKTTSNHNDFQPFACPLLEQQMNRDQTRSPLRRGRRWYTRWQKTDVENPWVHIVFTNRVVISVISNNIPIISDNIS